MRPDTVAIHAARDGLGGAHVPPIDLSTTYKTPNLPEATDSIDAMAAGGLPTGSSVYQRLFNPTVDRFERALAALEGTAAAVSYGSGMAAVTAAFLAAKMVGNHVVAVRPLYGGTDHLLASGLLGVEVSWATADTVADAIRPDTALVLCETPANPTLQLVDIDAVVAQANGVAVMVTYIRNTVLQQPVRQGAALVLHWAPSFWAVMAMCWLGCWPPTRSGRRASPSPNLDRRKPSPHGCVHAASGPADPAGARRAAQRNAVALAERLIHHPAVARVRFPTAPGCDPHGVIGRQMSGPYHDLDRSHRRLRCCTPGDGRGGDLHAGREPGFHRLLIQHPAGLTHRMGEDAQAEGDIGPGLLRLSGLGGCGGSVGRPRGGAASGHPVGGEVAHRLRHRRAINNGSTASHGSGRPRPALHWHPSAVPPPSPSAATPVLKVCTWGASRRRPSVAVSPSMVNSCTASATQPTSGATFTTCESSP